MFNLSLRFYGPLNDFLEPSWRQRDVVVSLASRASVKDVIESCGVPHPEVELVLVDHEPVAFDFVVERSARIATYPPFRSLELGDTPVVSAPLTNGLSFVLDGHLGRLAAYLRALGFDTSYERHADDAALARTSAEECRILLTRDVGLLKRSTVRHGRWVRSTSPEAQLCELALAYPLARHARPFSRCVSCNDVLEPRDKRNVLGRVPERSLRAFDEFSECPSCRKLYWPGSHYEKLRLLFQRAGISLTGG